MAVLNSESSDNLPSDEEPRLKYDRMSNDVKNILSKDVITCIAIHTKFVCLGSQYGVVYLLDHEGNFVNSEDGNKSKTFHGHTIAVNHISVDLNGDHIATCSDDGKVNIHGLYSSDYNHTMSLGKVIKTVALDPYYYKSGSGCRFLIGDNKLTLYEKTFFNRIKSTVLYKCEGYVQAVAWQDRFVALVSDVGVRVYDITARCSLGLIRWDANRTIPIEDYRCNLVWSEENILMIGWVDTVRICSVRKRRNAELQIKVAPEYIVDPIHTFQTDYFICGLAPLDDQLIILGYPKDEDSNMKKGQRPALYVIDYRRNGVFDISSDTLNIRGYEDYSCNDYHLASLIEENRFFIVSPKDIVIASQYDINDRIRWLIEHEFYEKAISILDDEGGKTEKYSVSSVGILHMDRILEKGDYEEAGRLYSKVCSIDKTLWEKEIYKFANINGLRFICQHLPTSSEDKLSSQVYELVLYEHMKYHPQGFLALVKKWDPTLYKINAVIKAVIEHLLVVDTDKNIYLESLGVLYCHQKKYDKSLSMYLKLQHEDVFKLIKDHNLYDFIHDKILALMKLDCDKAITIFLDKTKIPYEVVERQLVSNDFYLYKYLDALSKVDTSGKFHGKLVKLYAEFAREKLLPFLRSRDNYPIQEALDICKARNFYPETVYLLGRISSTKEALDIIISKLDDINQAISFCQEHDDKELWMDLINHCLDKPKFIMLLLKRIGNYVDPRILIQGIKPGCEIKDLKESLVKMMRDFNLQLSAQEACKAITFRNYFDLHEKLIHSQNKGMCISDEYICSGCNGKIIIKDVSHAADMIVYNCKHIFHMECLTEGSRQQEICAFCNPLKLE